MGNDGGSIPTRRELVKEAARNPTATELKDKQKEYLAHRWSTCPVSHKPLIKPIVSDYAGDLYNKDAIIQFLLPAEARSVDKQEYEKFIQGRITSLKDVVEVQFETEHDGKTKSDRWICPITSKELGPNVKAVYLVPCGHAFSQEAIKEMKSEGKCVQCASPYEERDVIPILPSSEKDRTSVLERIETLRSLGLSHSLKKAGSSKKRKANGDGKLAQVQNTLEPQAIGPDGQGRSMPANPPRSGAAQSGSSTPALPNGIKNAATASLTARVMEEEEARKKRRRENENISSLYTKKSEEKAGRDGDFMTRGFSIPANTRNR
ncbi:uncharacterized protein Z519_12510 [Cladophialophora bantiana CBS 173.52]|uniref:Uncharacterized protein n=1 Tax=Cladophialophora bantiana (strain ATCC 10958 / CBS 173.52 / CDC B-1940 / NIH 8579) TaxID=1442370 RepID=A0A0D2HR53_CLAB1|nr:uncharacterized protein Z519_12510 [Cladophialophora bantiana CBS 173.52]KIW86889.1 hypothetical protein Z519_12510 [Cladophialophora bantiana CBS 173.52]